MEALIAIARLTGGWAGVGRVRVALARALPGVLIAPALLAASGAAWAEVSASKSTIVAVSRQMSVPVVGRFMKFDAQINFDPAKPAEGTARLTVDTGSYDLGDAGYNDSVRGPEWFDAKAYPQATFVSTSIVSTGPNQYSVSGNMTIKGHTQPVVAPVVLTQQGATQIFDGTLPILRLAFGIGTGEWKDTSTVADEVLIKFHIIVRK